jgi:hypothetical protein
VLPGFAARRDRLAGSGVGLTDGDSG